MSADFSNRKPSFGQSLSPRAKDWLARLLLIVLPPMFFWRETLGWTTLGDQDAVFWFFPAYQFAAEQIASGSFPLWNPYQYGGIPFFAEWQSGVLDPLNWIHWLGATSRSLTLSLELSFAIALLAMFSYARSIGFTRRASLIAAIIFGFSGFLVGRTLYPGFVRIVALMPLVLCFTERLSQRGRWRDVVFGVLVIAWQIFAAHPQPLMYSSLLACAYALFRLRIVDCGLRIPAPMKSASLVTEQLRNPQSTIRNRISFLLKFSAMFLSAISLSAIQLLPAVEFATKSVRQEWPFELFTLHSLHPASLLVTLFPFFHGSGKTMYALPYWGPYWHHNEAQIYLSATALSLAAAGTIAAWKFRYGVGRFWSIVAVVGTVLAMGKYSGFVARALFHVPLVSHFRSPNRYWMVVVFAVAVLAGYAVDRLIRTEQEVGFLHRCLSGSIVMIALLVCGVGAVAIWQTAAFENLLRWLPDLQHWPVGFLRLAKWEFLLPMIVATSSGLALLVFRRTRWLPFAVFVLLLADFNLYAAFAPINNPAKLETLIGRAIPPELAAEQNPLQPIRYQIMLNAATGEFSPYWFYGHEMMAGYDPVLTERQKIFSGLDEAGRAFNLTMLEPQDRTLDVFNVRYVFVPPNLFSDHLNDPTRWREIVIPRDAKKPYADYRIFENLRVLPRVWLTAQARTEWEGDQLKLIRGQLPGFDPRRDALVVPETAAKLEPALLQAPPEGGTTNAVSILHRSPIKMVVETKTDKVSMLVFSEMSYPGWTATVDGVEAELLRVNYNLRGVQIAAGSHRVELRYWPGSLTKGAVITLMTALGLLTVVIWERRRMHRVTDADAESV